ncbi:DUF4328 domain-containing protein [Nocardia wallacei]|uniref:DUF4328 domain-containing protein n=1 Tax=Nocardia wallacei TaxID=480035 RepID=A0A7G1KHD6_9NOCA|nr:DUF4328 domain-containing protein [Nocardia wallacei]BCK54637.1 hypothetical protein NWFMUON74_24090 [Nocardia wallacei]
MAVETVRRGGGGRRSSVLGGAAIVLMAGTVALLFVSAVIDGLRLADFERYWAHPQGVRRQWHSDTWAGSAASFLLVGAGAAVIAWFWYARRGAQTRCAARHTLHAGWAIGGWFCPVVNIWFPHTVLADVVRASDPHTPVDAPDLRGRPAGALVTVWWLSFLSNWVLAILVVRLSAPEPRSKTTGEYVMSGVAPVGGWGLIAAELAQTGVLAVAAICLAVIIIRVQRWQGTSGGRPVTLTGAAAASTSATPWAVRGNSGAAPVSASAQAADSGTPPAGPPALPEGRRPAPNNSVLFIAGALIAVVVVTAVIGIGIASVDRPTDGFTRSSATATTSASGATPAWGATQWIADMFPQLLPVKPMPHADQGSPEAAHIGYHRLTCEADASTDTRIECAGDTRANRNPFMGIDCFRGPPRSGAAERYPLVETWSRRSGTVGVRRATRDGQDAIWLTFDDLPRSQCTIYSTWRDHRMDELLAWWRSTPL